MVLPQARSAVCRYPIGRPQTADRRPQTADHRPQIHLEEDRRDYAKIIAWQKADDLTVAVYMVTRGFPREELYGLTSQLRRAAYSVPANIVEGASRNSKKDYLHFLYMARGSLNETRYFLHLARRLDYLSPEAYNHLAAQAEETSRTLAGLIRSVESEVGLLGRTTARLSSLVFLTTALCCFRSAVCSLRSVVCSLRSNDV